MLLDSYGIKTGLTSLLSPAPTAFIKRVHQSFQKIDTLLKTLQVRAVPPEALVQAYLIHIADKNDINFRKILDIKGIRSKQEQNRLVELFQAHKTSNRHAPNLQESNPLISYLQPPAPTASVAPSVAQGLGLASLGGTTATSSGANALPTRFDPSMLGSALISAARDGVDRLGTPGLGNLGNTPGGISGGSGRAAAGSAAPSGSGTPLSSQNITSAGQNADANEGSSSTAANLNENLKNIGKFFRRDLSGLGGRFGIGGDDSGQR